MMLNLEDAIKHEESIISVCENSKEFLEDNKLVSFLEKEIKKHYTTKEQLMSLLEAKSNE